MLKRILAITLLLSSALVLGTRAQEVVSLTAPIVKTATTCSVDGLFIDVKNARIVANVSYNTGDTAFKVYDASTTPTGAALLHSLNTGNFSVNSLIKATYTRLTADGVCPGTVSGTPQD